MTEYQRLTIKTRLEWLMEYKTTWENNLKEGSSEELTYASTCVAKILEANAKIEATTETLRCLGYKVSFSPSKFGGIKCDIDEIK